MPSTAHRAANKASPGVNEEDQCYRESNLNPSPNKQPPPKDRLLSSSSLTPPHHNQAPGESVSATNTDSLGVRRSKRRRRSAEQHDSKRRATNNEYPGSAVSVSSSNANAGGTGPVEDEG